MSTIPIFTVSTTEANWKTNKQTKQHRFLEMPCNPNITSAAFVLAERF